MENEFTTSGIGKSEIIEIQSILQKYNISEEDEARVLSIVKEAYFKISQAMLRAQAILKLTDEMLDVEPDDDEHIDASID